MLVIIEKVTVTLKNIVLLNIERVMVMIEAKLAVKIVKRGMNRVGSAIFCAILSFCCLILASCSPESSAVSIRGKEMILIIDIDRSALEDGRVILLSQLENISENKIRFLPWNTPFDSSVNGDFLRIRTLDEPSSDLNYTGRMVKRAAPVDSDYLSIAPGEILRASLEVTNSYDFCDLTGYILEFSGAFYSIDGHSITVALEPLGFNVDKVRDC